jgi:hypothetical protein
MTFIPYMLEAFMAGDRGFRNGAKQQSSSGLKLTVNWHIGYNEEALEREDR